MHQACVSQIGSFGAVLISGMLCLAQQTLFILALGHRAAEHDGKVAGSLYTARRSGVEAAGMGVDTDKHAATITKGSPGVLHGSFSLLLQDAEGQVIDPHSISAG